MERERWISLQLDQLREAGNLRCIPQLMQVEGRVYDEERCLLNLSSNDYLGIGQNRAWRQAFLESLTPDSFLPTSSSSRLLTGNYPVVDAVEATLARLFGTDSALVFNSGYHLNTGLLPAIADVHTLILADKWVHASLIDGIRLSGAKAIRYRHNDLEQLARLVEKHQTEFRRIVVVTESIFSMDGDVTDLVALVKLKRQFPNLWLYVDEAHAFGVRGAQGLGCAEEQGCLSDIDFLVGTFGKAGASMGAYWVGTEAMRTFLVNKARPLIFSTALPPVNWAWTHWVLQRLPTMQAERAHLAALSNRLRQAMERGGITSVSESHIVPWVVGDSRATLLKAEELQRKGFYALPVRPPTVPVGTSRIRFSLTASLTTADIDLLIQALNL